MLVLGIESSCDETGAALIENGRLIRSNVVATQIEIHNRYGGVVPEVASRQQLAAILPVIETALERASCEWNDIDAVAAAYGPGLAGSLLVGLTVGKTLSLVCSRPFLGVNHLEAHIYANWLRTTSQNRGGGGDESLHSEGDPEFPLLCLVVSGAHSELVLVRMHGDYELLGQTRDDAAGEAFDKVARILGLEYPGGPAIQKVAQQAEAALRQQHDATQHAYNAFALPRAWLNGTYDFSFSGLKTAMLHLVEGIANQRESQAGGELQLPHQMTRYTRMGARSVPTAIPQVAMLAASFQEAVVDVLVRKTSQAAQEYNVRQVLLAGGVAANVRLRERLIEALQPQGIGLRFPDIQYCTDNAAMIGSAAFFHLVRGERHAFDLDVQPGLCLPFRGL